jgi:hypothetical protein
MANNLASAPADTSAMYFLDLPAEIRNHIYCELYEHPEPILVTTIGHDLGRIKLHRRMGDGNGKLPIERFHHDNETARSHQPGLSLFQTCRQISREAASVFYADNTFLITIERPRTGRKHDPNCAYGSQLLESWLRQLGGQGVLIKKICLDLDAMCRIRCTLGTARQHQGGRDAQQVVNSEDFMFLPFLKVVWKHKLRADINVARTGPRYHRPSGQPAPYEPFRVLAGMSTVLNSLCKDDLDIARFSRTLGCIALKEDGSGGDIVYRTTGKHNHLREKPDGMVVIERMRGNAGPRSHSCNYTTKQFSLGPDGKLYMEQDTTLLKLPHHIRSKIWEYITSDPEAHVVEINSTASFRDVASLLYISQNIRRQNAADYLIRGLTLKMSHTSADPMYLPVTKIERLLDTSVEYHPYGLPLVPRQPWWRIGSEVDLTFKLDLKLDTPTELADIRINILDFVIASSRTWNTTPVTFTLSAPTAEHQEVTMELGLLRTRVLKALKLYAKRFPEPDEICPEVWGDGYGQVVEVAPKWLTDAIDIDGKGLEDGTVNKQDVDRSMPSIAPQDTQDVRQLHSTIRDLAGTFRSWQKVR